jgi:EmrB/QacA subfamily drug resistance transporter
MQLNTTPSGPRYIAPRIQTNPWIVLVVLTLGFFMILLDTTIVNVAIPSMEKGLNAGFDEILWVLNAYMLIYAMLLITAGRLGDMFGPKRLFLIGLTIFTLASVACGLSQSAGQLITFRVIQAVGGALLTPQTLAMLPHIFPAERRGAAFGVWAGVAGLAAVIGPTLGGFLVTAFSWQSIFFVNLPVGIIALVSAIVLMPEFRFERRHNLDIPGVALASSGLFLLIFALIEGQKYTWGPISSIGAFSIGSTRWSLISIYSLIVYAIVLLGVFVWFEQRTDEPLLPLTLFRDRNFTLSNLAGGTVTFTMSGFFIPMTIFLQSVRGYSAVHAGLILAPISLGLLVSAPVAGRLADRINGKYLVTLGMVVAALGIALITNALSLALTPWDILVPGVVMGLGMGTTFAPLTTLAFRDVSPALSGAASGFLTTSRQVSMAIGSAVLGAVLTNQVAGELPKQAIRVAGQVPAQYRHYFITALRSSGHGAQQFGAGQLRPRGLPSSIPASTVNQLIALTRDAFDHAFLNGMRAPMAVAIIALLIGALTASFMRGGRSAADARKVERVAVAAAGE